MIGFTKKGHILKIIKQGKIISLIHKNVRGKCQKIKKNKNLEKKNGEEKEKKMGILDRVG